MKDNLYQVVEGELQQEIDNLYREGARETPPDRIDNEIRFIAQSQHSLKELPVNRKPGLRRFHYAVSTAASLMLLVSLVIFEPWLMVGNDSQPSDLEMVPMQLDSASIPLSDEVAPVSQSAPVLMKSAPQALKLETNELEAGVAVLSVDERLDAIAEAIDAGKIEQARELMDALLAEGATLTESQKLRIESYRTAGGNQD
ncbi:hypothetical protein [Shewanella sp.]|uniref:hypothetical protein n=1 Tax=Shewanella sp. TaxID=50422 RepID=UPI003564D44C